MAALNGLHDGPQPLLLLVGAGPLILTQDADVQGTIKIGEVEQGPTGLVAPGEAGCFLSSGLRGRFSLWDKGLGGLLGL